MEMLDPTGYIQINIIIIIWENLTAFQGNCTNISFQNKVSLINILNWLIFREFTQAALKIINESDVLWCFIFKSMELVPNGLWNNDCSFQISDAEMGLFLLVKYARLYFLVISVSPLPSTDSSGGRVFSRLCVLLRGQQRAAPFWWCIETTGQHPVRRIFTLAFYGGYTWWERSLRICLSYVLIIIFVPKFNLVQSIVA